jgi:hypothetical protein
MTHQDQTRTDEEYPTSRAQQLQMDMELEHYLNAQEASEYWTNVDTQLDVYLSDRRSNDEK